jgi:hypothetical protein
MKTRQIAAACALVAGFGISGSTFAQCAIDSTVGPSTTLPAVVSNNTCGKNNGSGGGFNLSSFCSGGNVPNGAGTAIVQVNTGGGTPSLEVSVVSSTSGFNPELAVLNGACASVTGCSVDDTNNTQTVPASGQDTAAPAPGTNSTVFVVVSDLNTEAPGCGAYQLTINGPLPVKLQNFSIN